MKKKTILFALLSAGLLASCTGPNGFNPNGNMGEDENTTDPDNPYIDDKTEDDKTDYDKVDDGDVDPSKVDDIEEQDKGKFSIKTDDGEFTSEGEIYTITKAGSYTLKGTIEDGCIIVDAGDEDEIELNLNGVSISSTINSPFVFWNADSVKVSSKKDSENVVMDNREAKVEDVDGQGNGAIYAKCDLSLTGKGKLSVRANYNNGIHTTKDLKVKNTEITVYSYNNALKGNDNVEIESGNLLLVSTGGNGIVTEDTDVSSKGNQRGNINIYGGTINIYSCKDAIDAAYNLIIENSTDDDGNIVVPVINVYTSNYSPYSGEVVTSEEGTKYLRLSTTVSSSERLAIYYQDSKENDCWSNCVFESSSSGDPGRGGPGGGGDRESYIYYKFDLPTSVTSIKVYKFEAAKGNSTTEYVACSDSITINANYDTMCININGSRITLSSWTTYSTKDNHNPGGPGGGGFNPDQGNTEKSDYSSKGFTADNIITISGGKLFAKTYDDGIHANFGDTFENGETGLGDVIIQGGDVELYAADDGIHADRYLTIKGGTINVTNAYEAIEANVISVNGGNTTVYATDDGLNASNKSGITPQIEIYGGKVDVTVASGDTDGIDSNGNYYQKGGIVVTRGSGTRMSTGLDADKTVSISDGTLLCFGAPEVTPSLSGNVQKQVISTTFSTGTYTFTCGDFSFSTTNSKMSYKDAYIYSSIGNNFTYTKA